LFFSMLSNLVKNALEASPEGVEVGVILDSRSDYLIEVKNQGEIPLAIRDRFLGRYVTFGKEGGTGLGVYSARLMAQTLGGKLCFHSSKETGTIITIEIPNAQKSAVQAAIPEKTGAFQRMTITEAKILIVDDYGYMRKIIADILHQMGFIHIQEAGNIAGAQAVMTKEKFDLIISDWNAPENTGLDLLKMVRSTPDGTEIPFIIIIGNTSEKDLLLAKKSGVTDIIAKPFSPDILKNKIESIFENGKNK